MACQKKKNRIKKYLKNNKKKKPGREHLVHVHAEDVRAAVADDRVDGGRDGLHAGHGDVLPPGVALHLDDLQAALGAQLEGGHLLGEVREHVVPHREAHHEVALGGVEEGPEVGVQVPGRGETKLLSDDDDKPNIPYML